MTYLPFVVSAATSVEIPVLDRSIAQSLRKDTQLGVLLYQVTDPADRSSLLLLSLDMEYQDVIGAKFTYDIWAGDPGVTDGTSNKLASAGKDIFFTKEQNKFLSPATAYLDNAALRQGIWMNVTNHLTSPLKFSAKLSFVKLPAVDNPVTLPPYTAPVFAYGGPSNLGFVDVGPGQTFPEMADAMPYVAQGFTMNVHAGQYFKPFLIPQGMDGWTIQAAPGVTADDIVCDGRGGWLTGSPYWNDNNPPGGGPVNPFRLNQGKGFIHTRSPGTVSKLGFWNCGGAYGSFDPRNIGEGEAAIYAESFAAMGSINVSRCTFDGNADSIFIPHVYANSTDSSAGPGPGANVKVYIDRCDFGWQVPNGQTTQGSPSHNFYINGAELHITNSNMYGSMAHAAKSRSGLMTASNCFFESWYGRAIDFPEGGSLTCTSCVIASKAQRPAIRNFMGIANEFQTFGPGRANFIDCTLRICWADTKFYLAGAGTYANFAPAGETPSRVEWYDQEETQVGGFAPALSYDTESAGHLTSGVTGIPFTIAEGGTLFHAYPSRPTPVHNGP